MITRLSLKGQKVAEVDDVYESPSENRPTVYRAIVKMANGKRWTDYAQAIKTHTKGVEETVIKMY